jgi:hypothetical protein
VNFGPEFRNAFVRNLQLNKSLLESGSIQIVSECVNSYFRVILFDLMKKFEPFEIDQNLCNKSIVDSINDESNPIFRLRKYYDDKFGVNEIEFKIAEHPIPNFDSPEYMEFLNFDEKLNYACEAEFWENRENINNYEKLSNFPPFNDAILPIRYINSFSKFKYNAKGWCTYITEVINFYFPKFNVCCEAGDKLVRFTRQITSELSFGFEFDKGYFSSSLKSGDPEISYLNLILFNNSFNQGLKKRPYLYEYNEDVLSLGILGNPFFYQPCFSFMSYAVVEMYYFTEDEDGNRMMDCRYLWGKEIHDDDTFSLIHPAEYGEKLKKHAFFYFAALAYSSSSYLDYLEKSIRDSI